jgi:hypothetical protein
MVPAHLGDSRGVHQTNVLDPVEEPRFYEWCVLTGNPAFIPIGKLAKVKAIRQDFANRVLGKRIGTAVASSPKASKVEDISDFAITPALGRSSESEQ